MDRTDTLEPVTSRFGTDRAPPRAVVVTPTFRRPALLVETLRSIDLAGTRTPFAIVVVENDAAGREGLAAARSFAARVRASASVEAVVEDRQGNVHAINRGFREALARFPEAEFFLMIDDDEIAEPGWIDAMVEAAEASGADIVGGPVWPRLVDPRDARLADHPAFKPAFAASGPVPLIYGSGNCLIRRRVFQAMGEGPFDPRFNFLGGGDTDFFTRAKRAGFRFHWAHEAAIAEVVPAERQSARWLMKRGLRIGAINRAVERKAQSLPRTIAKDLAVLAISLPRAARSIARGEPWLVALHPIMVGLGRVVSIFGAEPEQYRAAAGKTGSPS